MLLSRERTRLARRRIALRAASGLLTALTAASLHAQQDETPPDRDHAPFVLHVYANLMQFPTIVLGTDLKPLLPLSKDKFAITLDGGPVFHPTLMRIEGADPIALAVVLDAGGAQDKLIEEFTAAFPLLAPAFLHPNDRVTIYAQDCTLIRGLHDQPPERDSLRMAIEHALSAPTLHGQTPHNSCKDSLPLWDTLSVVAADIAKEPGRRVVLFVSLGKESKSITAFSKIAHYVEGEAVAVFRLRDSALVPDTSSQRLYSSGRSAQAQPPPPEDLFAQLCAVSGGMDLDTSRRNLTAKLQSFITILRNRYILEFPRPDDATAANHIISFTVPSTPAFIRATGGSAPLQDPAVLADPNTLHSAPSPAVTGKRRPLPPVH